MLIIRARGEVTPNCESEAISNPVPKEVCLKCYEPTIAEYSSPVSPDNEVVVIAPWVRGVNSDKSKYDS